MTKRILVARGEGWWLWWPLERWNQLAPDERDEVVVAQTALLVKEVKTSRSE